MPHRAGVVPGQCRSNAPSPGHLPRRGRIDSLPRRMPPSITRRRLEALLGASSRVRVAVIGDAMLDVYLRGDVDRISPEAPVPVVRVRDRHHALGGAANVAQNVAALGAACGLRAAMRGDM